MKALLRPLFVGGLSIAIAATTLVGSSSVALAATPPVLTAWSINAPVYEGDKPTITATFTDPDLLDRHTVDISWGDGSTDTYILPIGARSFAVQKAVPYLTFSSTALTVMITVSDPIFSTTRFLSVTVLNAPPSITSFALSSAAIDAGQAVTATGAFSDPGAADTHVVTVDWGDLSPATTIRLAAGVGSFTTAPHTYAAAGDFTVSATVTDNGGLTATATSTVSVRTPNQPPSIVSFVVTPGSEGGSSTVALTFADPDPADTHTIAVAWGDGATTDSGTLAATVTTFSASHVYADTGLYSVVLTLSDSAGHTVTASASVSPTNVAPVVGSLSLSPSSVVDHQTMTLSGAFTDPGTADTFTLTIDWGDTSSSTYALAAGTRTFSATHAYATAGSFTITATVTDRDGGRSSSTATLVVLPSNNPPANLVVQATAALEGGSTTLSVSFTDPEVTDTHTVAITWGDGSPADSVALGAGVWTTSLTHTYLETGTYTVAVTVTDGGGLSVAGGTTVTATNAAPSLSSLVFSPSSVTDHQTVTVSGTFSDPGTADTYTVTFAWGDGSTSSQSLSAGVRAFSGSHDYLTAGTYAVTVTVTDRDNGAGTQSASLVVTARNTPPSGLSLSTNVAGLSATVSGTFADPDLLDTHAVTVLWGDGTTSTSTLAAAVTLFTTTHTYSAAGTFTVSVTVTDPAGASTSATTNVVATVLASTPADVLDQMSALVDSFGPSPATERWLLRKIDGLRASLASGGNAQLCANLKILSQISAFAGRALTNDQAAALDALGGKLETAAGCAGTALGAPRVQSATRVTTTALPTFAEKKDATTKVTTTKPQDTEKADKAEKSANDGESRKEGRD